MVPTPLGTPVRVTGLLFIFAWASSSLRGTARPPRAPAVFLALAALVMWQAATTAWSYAPSRSTTQAVTTLSLAVSAIAVASTFGSNLIWPAFAMALGSALAGLLAVASGPAEFYEDGVTVSTEQATFLGVDQNILSFHLCLGMASALYVFARGASVRLRTAAGVTAAILVVAIIVVGSRTGIGSLIAMTALMVAISARSLRGALAAVAAIAVFLELVRALAVAGMIPNRIIQWLENPIANDSRTEIIDMYLVTRSDWAVTGVGAGADADYLLLAASVYKNAHSAFWRIWIETGLIGLAIWAILLTALAHRAFRSRERVFFLLTLPTIVAFFYTLGPLNSNMLWVVFGLALGASALRPSARRSPRHLRPRASDSGVEGWNAPESTFVNEGIRRPEARSGNSRGGVARNTSAGEFEGCT